jgi:hypothetical protein
MALSDWLARRRAVVWVAAVFLGLVLAGLLTLARPQLHENHVTLVLVLAVAIMSATGLRPAGLVAAVTTAIAYDYFWMEPYYSTTAQLWGRHPRVGRPTVPPSGLEGRSRSNTADDPMVDARRPEQARATPRRARPRATRPLEPLREQQRRKHEDAEQHRDHEAHSVLGAHRRCPARTAMVKTANENTVIKTKIKSATSEPLLDSGTHACYPTAGSSTRQAASTRQIREGVRFSQYFYA